ncbi:MAG: MFS transporter [Deltaproteobacteria bacterium]|nr:MFS transporter [Deltaproteobacteria bacterium]MBW2361725.1 MFS transporter [Deltaproteobacteria bacterium]
MSDSDRHSATDGSDRDAASDAGRRTSGVPLAMLLAYASPMLAVNFSLVLFMSFINKHAIDVLLVPPVAMGILFGVGRLWDAVTDPLAGVWSDRTSHRWGRRRPWLAVSALPIAGFGLMVWAPPATLGTTALIAWMAVAILGFNSAMTIFLTPHQALGAELTLDHHGVSRIFAARQAAGYVGMVGSLVVAMPYLMTASDPRGSATHIAVVSGVAVLLLVTLSVAILREPAENRRRGGKSAAGVARDVWKNRHARQLLAMIFIEHTGSGASMVLAPFLMQYVVGLPGKIGEIFIFYVGASLLSLSFWLWLSRRIGKKRAWLVGLGTGMLGYFALFFVGEGDLRWMQMVVTLTGAASACGTVLGSSILADVIDADELATGERKEGAYYSAYTFLFKSSSGVMAMLTGLALAWVGYEANAPQQTAATQLAIRSLNGLVPLASFAIGAVILAGFGLTEEAHASIRAQLDAKRVQGGGAGSSD